jgi:putative membrane protein
MTPFVPLHPRGFHGWEESSFSMLPFLGAFLLPLLLILLLAVTGLYLWRKGKIPPLNLRRRPEDEAKRILAERFARGDISSDEFMERSSILNWTPGTEPSQRPRKERKLS